MHKLLPVSFIVCMVSFILIISKILGILPANNTVVLIIIALELLLIFVAGLDYIQIKINVKKIQLFVPPLVILGMILYLFYSFKLYSFLPLALLVGAGLFLPIIILWKAEAKSLQYYVGIGLLGVLGGVLITYKFWDLSWISILLGIMTAVLIVYLSLLLEEEDEKPST